MKKVLIVLLVLVLLILLVAGGYVAYLFIDYHRIPDNQALDVTQNASETLPAGVEQSIVSWNIGFGAYCADYSFFMDGGKESRAYSEGACKDNINGAIARLEDLNPDLMLVQEVDFDSTRSYHVDQRQMIEEAFADRSAVFAQNYDSSYLFYPILEPHGASKSGILTLADAQIEGAMRRSLPIEGGINKFFDLDRCYSVSRIPVDDGKTLALYNLHLSAYTSDGSIANEQIARMMQQMQADRVAGHYVIAGGDFNKDLWGDSAAYTGISGADASWCKPFPTELIADGFALVNSLDEENLVLSCRDTGAPYKKGTTFEVTLDGFIVSDNVEVISCEVIDTGFANTDHNPVRMTFRLGGESRADARGGTLVPPRES